MRAARLLSYITALFHRRRVEDDLSDELQFHLQSEIEKNIAAGMRPQDARNAALRTFGGVDQVKEQCRDLTAVRFIEEMWQDLRFGLRMLRRSPGYTAVAVITVALGIGANTAIFSLIDAIMLNALPVNDPEQLVVLRWAARNPPGGSVSNWRGCPDDIGNRGCSFSYPTFEQVRSENSVFSGVFAVAGPDQLNVSVLGKANLAEGLFVSGEFFATLGMIPLHGRSIAEEDDRAGASAVAMLSYRYWERQFGKDSSIIGKSITVNGIPCTVAGVTDPGFFGLQRGQSPDMWLPLSAQPRVLPGRWAASFDSSSWWLWIIGRLKPDVGQPEARAELDVIFRRSLTAAPEPAFKPEDDPRLELTKISKGFFFLQKAFFQPLVVLMGAVGIVLVIACGNVANLQLARAAARQKEMAVRLALGAGRVRLVRQLLMESLLLAVAGGATGLLLARWATAALVSLIATGWMIPIDLDVQLNLRVLGFTAAASLLTGILFGLVPALRATQVDLAPALKVNASTLSRMLHRHGKWRLDLGRILVTSQVAMTLVLLVGATLLVQTLRNLRNLDLGFNPRNILLFKVDPTLNGYDAERISRLYGELLAKLNALPGVLSASFSMDSLLSGSLEAGSVFFDGAPKSPIQVNILRVGPRFFETMGIPLLLGRTFGAGDHNEEGALRVALVNERLARRYFPGQSPLGRRLGPETNPHAREIVGVVADAKYDEIRTEISPTLYLPYFRGTGFGSVCFELRTAGNPTSLISAVQRVVQEIDVDLPVFNVRTQAQQIDRALFQERLIARLSGLFGVLALVLAWVGLYGVISYVVTRRTNEIGIRIALGARQGDVLWMILRETLLLVLTGVGIGLVSALATTRLVSSLLFGLTATDPMSISIAVLLFLSVAVLAGVLPARRASRVDPMVALRYE